MKELRRILDESSDPVVRALLEASADDAPPDGRGRERAILAAGAALGVPSAAAAATPGAMKGASLALPQVLKAGTAKWLAVAVIAGGSAGTGYAIYTSSPPAVPPVHVVGRPATTAPTETTRATPAPTRAAAPSTSPPQPERNPVASAVVPPVIPPPAVPRVARPTASPGAPAPVAPAALEPRREEDPARTALALPPPPEPAAPLTTATTSSAPSLASELALLERARRALVAGRLADAEADLARHDAEFARGPLAPEAAVLRIELALARGDRARAHALADRLALEQPSSPYARRAQKLVENASP